MLVVPKAAHKCSDSMHNLHGVLWLDGETGSHRALSTQQERIGLEQGLLAPLFTSGALFGVYCVLTYFPDFDLKTLLSWCVLATVKSEHTHRPVL